MPALSIVGATTEDTLVERVGLILDTYLTAELAIVDAANNALAHSAEASFTTPAATIIVSEHVARYYGNPVEITVVATGQSRETEYEIHDQEPHSAQLPRLDLKTDIAVVIRVTVTEGESQDWARRCCNRIARAVRMILAKYTQGDVPDALTPLGPCWQDIESSGDERGPDTDEQAWVTYSRRLNYTIRTIEQRS